MGELNNIIKKIILKPDRLWNEIYIEEDSIKYNKYIKVGILKDKNSNKKGIFKI